jgi:uncharacterized protein YacL
MLRNAFALVAGLAVSFGVIVAVQMLGHSIWPPPDNLDRNDMDAIRTYISQLPFLALLFPIASYFLGAIGGPLIACRIGTAQPIILVGIIGLILLAATIANLIQIPHPIWFSVLAVAAVIVGGWLALQLAADRKDSSAPG